jgi:hypothetical protein
MEERDNINKILNKITRNQDSLHISRVPKKDRDKFIELANEEFAGDYGMCLKYLLGGLLDSNQRMLLDEIEDLNERLTQLEARVSSSASKETSEDKKTIKTVNGKEIKR